MANKIPHVHHSFSQQNSKKCNNGHRSIFAKDILYHHICEMEKRTDSIQLGIHNILNSNIKIQNCWIKLGKTYFNRDTHTSEIHQIQLPIFYNNIFEIAVDSNRLC